MSVEVTLVVRVEGSMDDDIIDDMRDVIENADWGATLVDWTAEEV